LFGVIAQMLSAHSRFRHVYGSPASRDQCYDGVRVSTGSGHDATLCAVNGRFLAVIAESSGGGVFVVIPLHMVRSQWLLVAYESTCGWIS